MTTFEEIRYAYVWQTRTGMADRGRVFDEWLRGELEQAFACGFLDAEYQETGFAHASGWKDNNPYRKEENA